MRFLTTRTTALAAIALAAGLTACQGNLGTGSGISIPNTPQYNPQPGAPGAPTTQSRQHAVDGAVFLTSDMTELPLPPVDGFAIALALGTPGPSPSPTASGASVVGPGGAGRRPGPLAKATASPAPSPSPSPAPSPSAATSASPGPAASGAPSPAPSDAKTVTKTTAYPDDAPAAPSPQPSGNVQVFASRKAIVRGFVQPASDVALYGLGAVRFTIPAAEQTPDRGFTVALYQAGKHHHDTLVASDARASLANNVVASNQTSGLTLKKGDGYLVILYGDELPPTPAPVQSGYPSPGANPFYTAPPAGAPGAPTPGYPGSSPIPGASYPPQYGPTYPPH